MTLPANIAPENVITFWYNGKRRENLVVDTIEPQYKTILCRTTTGYKRFKVDNIQTLTVVKR